MFKWLLKNYRRGFATNSSSSHSFVYLKTPVANHDVAHGVVENENEFGWDDFRLSTLREKLFYVLVSRVSGGWRSWKSGDDEFPAFYEANKDDFPEFQKDDFRAAWEGYVDHESVGLIDIGTARDPRVVIYGGNDNSGDSAYRARDVANQLIDWSSSRILSEDEQALADDDTEGKTAFKEKYGW